MTEILIEVAVKALNATPADIAGLWNAPGYPELTTGQLFDVARQRGAFQGMAVHNPIGRTVTMAPKP